MDLVAGFVILADVDAKVRAFAWATARGEYSHERSHEQIALPLLSRNVVDADGTMSAHVWHRPNAATFLHTGVIIRVQVSTEAKVIIMYGCVDNNDRFFGDLTKALVTLPPDCVSSPCPGVWTIDLDSPDLTIPKHAAIGFVRWTAMGMEGRTAQILINTHLLFMVNDYVTLGVRLGAFGHWDDVRAVCTINLGTPLPIRFTEGVTVTISPVPQSHTRWSETRRAWCGSVLRGNCLVCEG